MSETYSLTVERVIPGPIEEVFDAWLDPASLKQWMKPGPMTLSEATVNPVVGGRYTLMFAGDGKSIPHDGEYREITRPHRLVFTWQSEGAGDTVVTIAFARVADRKTRVTLTHEQFVNEGARDGHRSGWGGILEKLEQTMEARR
jgi:uncharacterized protein YndB with AHSA1/START domain